MVDMVDLKAENDQLKKQVNGLNNQLQNNAKGVDGLVDQLDGHKSMINDNIAQNLNLRANCFSLQKKLKAMTDENETLKKEALASLAKIAELEKPAA